MLNLFHAEIVCTKLNNILRIKCLIQYYFYKSPLHTKKTCCDFFSCSIFACVTLKLKQLNRKFNIRNSNMYIVCCIKNHLIIMNLKF